MYIRTSLKYNKRINIIHPGEYYVSKDDEIISTLLGSCVAVCLYDSENRVSGMNHFMLPGRISETDVFADRSAKYGITAINDLLHHMEKTGAVKHKLTAKLFGGGHITSSRLDLHTIPHDNVRLAKILIEMEDIPIVELDVGDIYTRKLFMDVKSGRVFLKKISRAEVFRKLNIRDREFLAIRLKSNEESKSIDC
ncbi:MAG: chemotaxis protein CheD [Spirochaetota bacterium]